MKKFQVLIKNGNYSMGEVIHADSFDIEDACLVFYKLERGRPVKVKAFHEWARIDRIFE